MVLESATLGALGPGKSQGKSLLPSEPHPFFMRITTLGTGLQGSMGLDPTQPAAISSRQGCEAQKGRSELDIDPRGKQRLIKGGNGC